MERIKNPPTVLVICDYYLPGIKGGGGARTVANMVERMSDRYSFLVVCRDHDGRFDRTPYSKITYDQWNPVGQCGVRYLRPGEIGPVSLSKLICRSGADLVYLNSVFSGMTVSALVGRLLGLWSKIPVVLAPCGELGKGALAARRIKKQIFLRIARLIRLYRGALWKASTDIEAGEITALFPDSFIRVAPDVVEPRIMLSADDTEPKRQGALRLVYLSRITPKKNLLWLMEVIRQCGDGITLDVFGDTDDPEYERRCIASAPSERVRFHGPLDHEDVSDTLSRYDLMVLPTKHENFCHVILEAMRVGLPVLVSDQTPWSDVVTSGGGAALPLDRDVWKKAIGELCTLEEESFLLIRIRSREAADNAIRTMDDIGRTAAVLDEGLKLAGGRS